MLELCHYDCQSADTPVVEGGASESEVEMTEGASNDAVIALLRQS